MRTAPKRNFIVSAERENQQIALERMVKTEDKARKNALIRRLIFFFIVACGVAATFFYVHYQDLAILEQREGQRAELTAEVQGLIELEQDLQQDIRLLNDEEYLLKLARTRFFFSREGETIFPQNEN